MGGHVSDRGCGQGSNKSFCRLMNYDFMNYEL